MCSSKKHGSILPGVSNIFFADLVSAEVIALVTILGHEVRDFADVTCRSLMPMSRIRMWGIRSVGKGPFHRHRSISPTNTA